MAQSSHISEKFEDAITGKKGLIASGVIGGLAALVTVFFFLFPYFVTSNPGVLLSQEARAMRMNVLEKGSPKTRIESTGSNIRSENIYTLEGPTGGVYLDVSKDEEASDFYEFVIDAPWRFNETNFTMRAFVYTALMIDLVDENSPFGIEVYIYDENGDDLILPEIDLPVSVHAIYSANIDKAPTLMHASDRRGYFSEEDFEVVVDAMTQKATASFSNLPSYVELFGYKNGKGFMSESANLYHTVKSIAKLARISIYSSGVAVASLSLFFGSLILRHTKKKENRSKIRLFSPNLVEEDDGDTTPTEIPKESRFEVFLEQHHIKPIFGEWFFRIIGLILVASCSFILSLFTRSYYENWGEEWITLADNTTEIFENISAVGTFMLLIAVIGIIAETRRNLHISAWLFISLSIGNYLFSCATLFSYQIVSGRHGAILANNAATSLPGNVFLGIGLFSITGFFLFFNPPRSVINRKTFRCLSFIPTSIALLSVLTTYLYKSESYVPSYWVRNILFIRDSSIVFMGIFYEYAIFVFQAILSKRYGAANARKLGEKPFIQFQKNASLGVVIVILTVIFYLIPSDQRANFGFSSTQAFYFVLIPFFLFYKPSGRHYSTKSNIIYYVLYAIAWSLPSIPGIISTLSNMIQ